MEFFRNVKKMGTTMQTKMPPHADLTQVSAIRPIAGKSTWIVGSIALIPTIIYTVIAGIGGTMIFISLLALLTGLYVLITGRPSWLRLTGRKMGGFIVVGAIVGFVAAGVVLGNTVKPAPAAEPASTSTSEAPNPVLEPLPAQAPAEVEPVTPAAADPAPPIVADAVPATATPNVSYENCAAVWAATGGPISVGQPGFNVKFDKDGDGVGCEERPKNK